MFLQLVRCCACMHVCLLREAREKRSLEFSIKAAQLLTCPWQKSDPPSSGASCLCRVCCAGRKGNFHPKYHCVTDVMSIILSIFLKESERQTLTITWSAQTSPHYTGSNCNLNSVARSPYTQCLMLWSLRTMDLSVGSSLITWFRIYTGHNLEERKILLGFITKIFIEGFIAWEAKPIDWASCIP